MSTQKDSKTISFFKFYNIVAIIISVVYVIISWVSNSIILTGVLLGLTIVNLVLVIISGKILLKEDE